MSSEDPPPFGVLLREMRLAKRLTQEALAERARLSVEAVGALERGSRKAPYPQTVALLGRALELDGPAIERLRSAAARTPVPRSDGRTTSPKSPATVPARHNFPERLTRFIGRDEELLALTELVAQKRLTTITGAGGVGKTRLAIELGAGIHSAYRDGAVFVELGPVREAGLLPQEIAAALQLRETPGQTAIDNIVDSLRERRMLFVVDNCEHLVTAAARILETILQRCPQITIVATSREALRIGGECVFRLATFSVPEPHAIRSVESALRHSSVALFVERAQSVDSSFTFTATNVADIARICRRVDGIPLAIEIVSAQVSIMEPAQIAGRLQQRFPVTEGSRTAVPRQRSLRSLVAWSVDLLSAEEQIVFRRLAVFAAAWTVEAAETICAGDVIADVSVLTHLYALVQKSLVAAENDRDGRRRFRLLEMTRDYALELLEASGEFDAVMVRHAAYVLAFARAANASADATPDLSWLEMVEREIENARTVLEWSLQAGNDVATGAEIASMLGHYWDYRSYSEGTRWLAIARSAVDTLEPELAARVLLESIRIQPYLNEAYPFVHRALEEFRRLGNAPGMFGALELLGKTLINLGRHRQACDALNEAIELARTADDGASVVRLTVTLAFGQLYDGQVEAALASLAHASNLVPENGRNRDSAYILRGFAEAALVRNDIAVAIDMASRFLALLERLGDRREAAAAHYLVAQAMLAAGHVNEASAHVQQAIPALRGAEFPLSFLEATIVAAAIFERQKKDAAAARFIGYVQRRTATFPFRPTPLIDTLLDSAVDALTHRMSEPDFRFLIAQGRTFDDDRIVAELP